MSESMTEAQVSEIVKKVVNRIVSSDQKSGGTAKEKTTMPEKGYTAVSYQGRRYFGVFETMEEALEAASESYKKSV